MASVKTIKFRYVSAVQNKKALKAFELAKEKWGEFDALIIAVDNNFVELVRMLLKEGYDVNEIRPRDKATALHAAANTCNVEVVRLLLENGADRSLTDASHLTPLARNLKSKLWGKSLGVYEALKEGMSNDDFCRKNKRGETLLHIMSRNRTAPLCVFEEILSKGVDVNRREDYFGRTFLHDMVVFFSDQKLTIRVAELALRKNLRLNRKDMFGNSLLHRIASEERVQVLKWACNVKDFQIRKGNKNDQTAIYIAVRRGNVRIMQLLYRMGETVTGDAYEYRGSVTRLSMLEMAEYKEHDKMAKIIRREIEGERMEGGALNAKPLTAIAKGVIREALALEGKNICPKVAKLELPKSLREYILHLDCDV